MKSVLKEEGGSGVGDPTRRNFLQGVAALGASALLPSTRLSAQAPAGQARAIDCHHHFGSPAFSKALAAAAKDGRHMLGYRPIARTAGTRWTTEEYSPSRVVEWMDQNDVATAVVSVVPEYWLGDPEETRFLCRDLSEFGAKMISDHKGRFGLFAPLPLPNVEDSIRHIEYALDTLKADGIGVWTSYEKHWLGDRIFRPVFDELNRRKAVVFVHPTDPNYGMMPGLGTTALEFLTETMRTIYSLLMTGAATRYGDIRFIFSHAGGSMPSLIERYEIAEPGSYPEVFAAPAEPNSNLYHLRRFYYDVANSCNPAQLQALKIILGGTSHIIFGSDWPSIPTKDKSTVGLRQLQGLQKCGLSAQELAGIQRGNAVRELFPRLAGNGTA
jgi:predicted TIM-barrel fold metal-dependent hydrolase